MVILKGVARNISVRQLDIGDGDGVYFYGDGMIRSPIRVPASGLHVQCASAHRGNRLVNNANGVTSR